MKTTRHLVAAFVEFTAGVKHRQHDLECTLVLLLVHVDRDSSAIVDNGYRIVLVDCDLNVSGIACKRLVN